jgi:pyruvate formate lyase activating enzyme
MMDISAVAADYGLSRAMITNGYINQGPLADLLPIIDAFNVDLKAFNNNFYRKYTGSTLKPVLNSISKIAGHGNHLEITMLIIEGLNDDLAEFEEAVKWISSNTGRETPLHISRYFPRYRMSVQMTLEETLLNLWEIASEHLDFVYLGNTHRSIGQNTHCPSCGSLVTVRKGYDTTHLKTGQKGECSECGKLIYSNFKPLQYR